ncbi:MAG: hypothetical protein CMN76_03755 [Spirochaetaceae bacterium]|nr:hypothetical protein [Spirochaetaceae bacterium]|tara:strand:- start:209909 stop:210304 length:396 start_codon:yes stop_codon:yes gene_type:complete
MPYKNLSKILQFLKTVYSNDNTDYSKKYSREIGYKTDCLSPDEAELLRQHNLQPNNFPTFSHDELLGAFLKLRKTTSLTGKSCSRFFIKGLSGGSTLPADVGRNWRHARRSGQWKPTCKVRHRSPFSGMPG